MNQKEKGMFDRFLLALGSVALMPPHTAMPIGTHDRFGTAWDARPGSRESAQECAGSRARVRWAT